MVDIKSKWNKTWPHLVALGIFMALTIVYFSPEFTDGKQLSQADMVSAQGMGHDAELYFEQTGERSHWSNSMFGGLPHNVTFGLESNNVFTPVSEWIKLGLPRCSSALLWLLLLGFYVFMIACGAGPLFGIVGSIAFAFGSYNLIIIAAGHVTKALVISTIPAIVGGCMLCYRKKYLTGFIITLIAAGLNICWNHQQISYYTILMLIPLAVAYLVSALKSHTMKQFGIASGLLILAAVLSVVPASDRLLPTMDYAKESMRGGAVLATDSDIKAEKNGLDRDYAFMWSYGKAETMTLLIPNFYGGGSTYPIGTDSETYSVLKEYMGTYEAQQFCNSAPTYWGDQPFTSGPVYAGAIICFLFLLGLFVVKGPSRWWLLISALIGVLLSWGRNFPGLNNFLFDHLPLYNKFRTPSMALVMTTTAMAMLGMLAFKEVLEKNVKAKDLYLAAGITGAICLIFALFPGIAGSFESGIDSQYPDWFRQCLQIDRRALLVKDALRSFLFIGLAFAVLWIYTKSGKMKNSWAIALVGAMILIDMWSVDRHYLNESNFVAKSQKLIQPTEADMLILEDEDPDFRVLNLTTNTFNESHTSYFHKSVGGYSPAKLRRYQDIIDHYMSGSVNMNVLNMLNTKYFIMQDGVQLNPYAYGNAWLVESIDWADNPNEEIEAIADADLTAEAIIDTCWRSRMATDGESLGTGTIRLTDYANPGHIFYESECDADGLAVFSEVYYKTWKAYVDGERVPLLRADYILRAIEVPAGRHSIEFKCEDDLFIKSHAISLVGSILAVLALAAAGVLLAFKKKSAI
ncbi:MAG: hypothetical protein MJY89_03430 [Bacteroidales bacterium]|nr:hypothetical protein [Bacteroidales bacterium]